jgi:DNA-binding response OmpR family regulator
VKPFSMRELVARVRAAARRGVRADPPTRGEPVQVEELLIDPHAVQAFVDGQSAELTPTEFRLLHALALEGGRVVTRDELMQRVWGRPVSPSDVSAGGADGARAKPALLKAAPQAAPRGRREAPASSRTLRSP